MDVRGAGEARLAELKGQLLSVQGTPTEVYSRIVGYYRSVRNWNAGKREEFGRRKEYSFPQSQPWEASRDAAPVAGSASRTPEYPPGEALGPRPDAMAGPSAALTRPVSYILFTRPSCHQCPPVREYMAGTRLLGQIVDVDSDEGPDLARAYEVMATPTVVLLDADGEEVARGYTRSQLMAYIAPAMEASYA
jgi:ribonucleoside-triphosphate reductase